MEDMSRRKFLGCSTKTLFALGAAPLALRNPVRAASPNEKVSLAAIGVGGRCKTLISGLSKQGDVHFQTLCDVHPQRKKVREAQAILSERQGKAPAIETEFRRVLDDASVDGVIVGTPDHWHAPMAIFSCQAGKDVYVEKPPSHNIWEGRKMVEAAKRYGRVVQVGTQNRSAPYVLKALELVRDGRLGKIHLCKVYNAKSGKKYTRGPDGPVPQGVDYDTWLGPVSERPYNESICFKGGWHKFWDFSGGDLADDGVHQLDIARWLVGKGLPHEVHCTGGNFAFQDDREVPDTQVASFTFDDLVMTCDVTQWAPYMRKTNGSTRGGDKFPGWMQNATRIELYGTKSQMVLGRHGGGWQIFAGGGEVADQMYGRFPDAPHLENFIECIRTRQTPNAPAEEGHRSAALVHLANISQRLGGRQLRFDAKTERFVGDEEADRLLRREYRDKFRVPEIV